MKSELDLKNAAVLVVDMQNDYCHGEGVLAKEVGFTLKNIQSIIPRIEQFLVSIKAKGVPVLYTQMTEDLEVVPKNLRKKLESKYENGGMAIRGTWGHELVLDVGKDAKVFQKNTFDALSSEDLKKHLKENGVKTLIVAGVVTHSCVDTTIRSAVTQGFDVVLLTDLVASPDQMQHLHDASLKTLTWLFAHGFTSDELVSLL